MKTVINFILGAKHSNSQNPRMVKAGRDLKDLVVPAPYPGRDTFH